MEPTRADPCVYVMSNDQGGLLVVILYVDDLIVAGSSVELVELFKRAIADRFKMKDLGNLKWILGVDFFLFRPGASQGENSCPKVVY